MELVAESAEPELAEVPVAALPVEVAAFAQLKTIVFFLVATSSSEFCGTSSVGQIIIDKSGKFVLNIFIRKLLQLLKISEASYYSHLAHLILKINIMDSQLFGGFWRIILTNNNSLLKECKQISH